MLVTQKPFFFSSQVSKPLIWNVLSAKCLFFSSLRCSSLKLFFIQSWPNMHVRLSHLIFLLYQEPKIKVVFEQSLAMLWSLFFYISPDSQLLLHQKVTYQFILFSNWFFHSIWVHLFLKFDRSSRNHENSLTYIYIFQYIVSFLIPWFRYYLNSGIL